jgi:hypothetical protein
MLTRNEIYLSSPADFNDPFDCRIPKNFYILDTDEKIWEYCEKIERRLRPTLKKHNINIKQKKLEFFQRIKNYPELVQKEHEEEMISNQDNYYGIFSLGTNWNNILMWSHYADYHKGFCVGFDEEELRNSAEFHKGGRVEYSNDFPKIDPRNEDFIEVSFKKTNTKAKKWKYENEYRMLFNYYPKKAKKEDRIVTISDDCYSEIIVGLNFPEVDIPEIKEIANKKNITVYQARKVPFKFEITREKL